MPCDANIDAGAFSSKNWSELKRMEYRTKAGFEKAQLPSFEISQMAGFLSERRGMFHERCRRCGCKDKREKFSKFRALTAQISELIIDSSYMQWKGKAKQSRSQRGGRHSLSLLLLRKLCSNQAPISGLRSYCNFKHVVI